MRLIDRRFLFVTGKGGVGKTAVSAAIALAAARAGKYVLLAQCNVKDRLSTMLEVSTIDPRVRNVAPLVDAVNMEPYAALSEYGLIVLKVRTLHKAIFENKFVSAFLHGIPGMDAWAMLGKAYFHATTVPSDGSRPYDLVIVDAPATGHALDMLRVPKVIQEVAPPGLLRREAERALALMRDSERAGLVLVTLAEDMPINETLELRDIAREELDLPIAQIIANGVLPPIFDSSEHDVIASLTDRIAEADNLRPLAVAGRARVLREDMQRQSLAKLKANASESISTLPWLFLPEFKRAALETLADSF